MFWWRHFIIENHPNHPMNKLQKWNRVLYISLIYCYIYLVEKVLYKCWETNVEPMTMHQQGLFDEFEPTKCVVARTDSLTALLTHDTWKHITLLRWLVLLWGFYHYAMSASEAIFRARTIWSTLVLPIPHLLQTVRMCWRLILLFFPFIVINDII